MLGGAAAFGKENTTYSNDVWEDSSSQTAMRNAYAAGVKKILVTDNALRAAVKWGYALVGDDNDDSDGKINRFYSYASLDNWVKGRLVKYCYEDGFYGVVLNDEPVYGYTANLGEVYKSIKRVAKELDIEVYIHLNLLPADVDLEMIGDTQSTSDRAEIYRSYIENILIATQAERLSVDIYPFMNWGFKTGYYSMLQVFTDVCKKYGVSTSLCVQSFSSNDMSYRQNLSVAEIYYQLNNALAYGFDHIYFYTYLPNEVNDSSFVTSDGNATAYYNDAKAVLGAVKKLYEELAVYDYRGSKLLSYTKDYAPSSYIANYFSFAPQEENSMVYDNSFVFAKVKDVTVDDDLALITELKDEAGNFVYAIQNVMDDYYVNNGSEDGTVTVTVDFGSNCCGVYVYYVETTACGGETVCAYKSKYVAVSGNAYAVTLTSGNAVFVKPVYH